MKAIRIVVAVFAASMIAPPTAGAAGFSYGSVRVAPASGEFLLTYQAFEMRQSQVCNLTTLACDPRATTTAPAVTGEIGAGGYILSTSGKLALVSESDAAGNPINKLYKVLGGTLAAPVTLAVTTTIRTILITPDDSKAVVRTPSSLILLDLQTGAALATVAWNPDDRFSFARVSPDGRYVAYFTAATLDHPTRHFRIVDVVKGATYSLSEKLKYWDLLSEENSLFQFSPDGKTLIYKDDREGPATLYQVDVAKLKGTTFKGVRLFSKSYVVADFMLLENGTLLYIANRATPLRFDLYAYTLKTGALRLVAQDALYYPALRRAGNFIFFNHAASWGSEAMAYDIAQGVVRALPAPQGVFAHLKPGVDIALPNGVRGALLVPDNFNAKKPHKVLIWLHGGPHRQAALGYHSYASYGVYDWMLEGLRQNGVVVLKLDYHGSYAHGRPFAESIVGNVGVKDTADVLAALATLKKKYNLSQAYLSGVSYGGYLSLRTLVEQPARFAGAISINGVTDWLTLVNRNPDTIFAADFKGPLTAANASFYDRASILEKTPRLTTQKVVLLHSRNDTEVSFSQSSSYAGILKTAGKNVEFTELPDDDHVLTRSANAMTVCAAMFRTLGLAPGGACDLTIGIGAGTGAATSTSPGV